MVVCKRCGVAAAITRTEKWIHVASIPREFDEHDVEETISLTEFEAQVQEDQDVKALAEDLIRHHVTVHPATECEWVSRLSQALRSA